MILSAIGVLAALLGVGLPLAAWATAEQPLGVVAVEYADEVYDARDGLLLLGAEEGVSVVRTGHSAGSIADIAVDGRLVQARLIHPPDGGRPTQWVALVQTEDGMVLEERDLDAGDAGGTGGDVLWRRPLADTSRMRAEADGVVVVDIGRRLVGIDLARHRVRWQRSIDLVVATPLAPGEPVDREVVPALARGVDEPLSFETTTGEVAIGYTMTEAEARAGGQALVVGQDVYTVEDGRITRTRGEDALVERDEQAGLSGDQPRAVAGSLRLVSEDRIEVRLEDGTRAEITPGGSLHPEPLDDDAETVSADSAGLLARLRYRLGGDGVAVRREGGSDESRTVYLSRDPMAATLVNGVAVVLANATTCPAARDRDLTGRVLVLL